MDFSERKSLLGALCVACDWLRKCYGFFREEKGGSVACPQGRAEEKGGSVACPQGRAEEKCGSVACPQGRAEEKCGSVACPQGRAEEKSGNVAWPQGRAEEKSGSEIFIYMVREILRVERSETPASPP